MSKQYPLSAPYDGYAGKDAKRRDASSYWNHVESAVVSYLNNDLSRQKVGFHKTYSNADIARAINESPAIVAEITSRLDGGSSGISCHVGPWEVVQRRIENPDGLD